SEMGVVDVDRHAVFSRGSYRIWLAVVARSACAGAATRRCPRGSKIEMRITNCASWMFFDEKLTELAATMMMSRMIAHTAWLERRSNSTKKQTSPIVRTTVWMTPNCTTLEIQKF